MSGRVCRACGRRYDYPALRSLATRAHCDDCAALGPQVRRVLERLTRRLDRMAAELQELRATLPASRTSTPDTGE